MSGSEAGDRTCRYCGAEIMYVGALWLKRKVADVNGFCAKSPDDLHHPASETRLSQPDDQGWPGFWLI